MSHIKLTIPGKFWDTQLYSGRLFIFDCSGGIFTVNWNNYIDERFEALDNLQLAAHVCFLESDLFYTDSSQKFLANNEIKEIVVNNFELLAQLNLTLELTGRNVTHINSHLPFPHADSGVYYSKLYVGLNSGVYSVSCNGLGSARKSTRLWDCPTLGISPSNYWSSIAIAAGNQGLYEMKRPQSDEQISEPVNVSQYHCSSCEWSGRNIIASSYIHSAFFAAFKKLENTKNIGNQRKFYRELEKIIKLDDLFQGDGYSWGSHDKLYMYRNNEIECIQYSANRDDEPDFARKGVMQIAKHGEEVVSANVAAFGTIIEYDNSITVIKSTGEMLTIPGEPVNWRIFPNSFNYKNQLHVIYGDRLEIYSFYHDYFVEQPSKFSGIEMKSPKG
jgi:hypothetical protein